MCEENLTLDRVETWTVAALKEYVKKRGLPVTGTNKVLAARAYVAWELQLPVLPTPAQVAEEKRLHMERLLKTPLGDQPHPDSLTDGWLDEDQGMSLWPPTMIQDIAVFLDDIHQPENVSSPKDCCQITRNRRRSAILPATSSWNSYIIQSPRSQATAI